MKQKRDRTPIEQEACRLCHTIYPKSLHLQHLKAWHPDQYLKRDTTDAGERN